MYPKKSVRAHFLCSTKLAANSKNESHESHESHFKAKDTHRASVFRKQKLASTQSALCQSVLSVEPVEKGLRLTADRYYLWVTDSEMRWHLGIQLSSAEATQVYETTKHLDWTIDENEGHPIDVATIWQAVERLLTGGEL
jgi:hypothetical protein